MPKLSELLQRSVYILKTEGFNPLFSRGVEFISLKIYKHEYLYLYEQEIMDWKEADYTPILPDLRCEIIRGKNEISKALPDYLDTYWMDADKRLEKGAIAVCLFAGGELAHISWLALNDAAKESFDERPYAVEYSKGQACTGGTFTHRKFRGQKLMTYANYYKFQYLKCIGVASVRHAVKSDNLASQTGYAKFGPRLYARARYIRLFGFKYWRETPVA